METVKHFILTIQDGSKNVAFAKVYEHSEDWDPVIGEPIPLRVPTRPNHHSQRVLAVLDDKDYRFVQALECIQGCAGSGELTSTFLRILQKCAHGASVQPKP